MKVILNLGVNYRLSSGTDLNFILTWHLLLSY